MSDNIRSLSYLSSNNAAFIEELYQQFIQNPESVEVEWQQYFKSLGDAPSDVSRAISGAPWMPSRNKVIGVVSKDELKALQEKKKANMGGEVDASSITLGINAIRLIDAYRTYGHMGVTLDPLGMVKPRYHSDLDYKTHGFTDADLDREITLGGYLGIEKVTLRNLVSYLEATYSSRVAAEFMHIESPEERTWLKNIFESTAGQISLSKEERIIALNDVTEAEMFENYLHTKFPGTKRFSVEGLESFIAGVEVIVRDSTKSGVNEFAIGMAHRGRLNMLTKVMHKPYHAMFSEFKGEMAFPAELGIPGDVKYHLGASTDIDVDGKKVHISLVPNPSHLEVVNAVVLGKVRAKQDLRNDTTRSQVLGILMHGDAAFAGQGSVMEALALSQLQAYHVGGTIHLVTNNQIGFTTNPDDSRSTLYCTDIAKFIGIPIFHVNGDDVDAVIFVSKLASQYRALFKKDVVIDVVGYRKYGHNEGDEPLFTQPAMYNIIKNKKNPAEIYAAKLIAEGVISASDVEAKKSAFKAKLDKEFEISQTYKVEKADWLKGKWSELSAADINRSELDTGIAIAKLKEIGKKLCETPDNFKVNSKIARQLEAKLEMINSGKGLDWAAGESLAFATLLAEGYPIRMTGQDVERGTFSHRHAVLVDQESEFKYVPMNNLSADQKAKLEIKNSNLSEFGVLGFEYGYSFTHPDTLTIWEAQFGDFANGAQVVIDQYITSGEAKWLKMNGLVMLLPHGYEGQGPEHSSARLERFLQLCARDNIQVACPTTPASLFHILRRQLHRNFRKPLVIMSPKSLLRHKLAISDLSEFAEGTKFRLVLPETDASIKPGSVKRVIFCTGKVYYDLVEQRQKLDRKDTVILRLEQIYPFPKISIAEEVEKYPNAEIVWCQEEHENMGAFYFVEPRFERVLTAMGHAHKRVKYVGRNRSASPAAGYMKIHVVELSKLLEDAFAK
jgi:2-oxoglutarate dehydrogenase E1 component